MSLIKIVIYTISIFVEPSVSRDASFFEFDGSRRATVHEEFIRSEICSPIYVWKNL